MPRSHGSEGRELLLIGHSATLACAWARARAGGLHAGRMNDGARFERRDALASSRGLAVHASAPAGRGFERGRTCKKKSFGES